MDGKLFIATYTDGNGKVAQIALDGTSEYHAWLAGAVNAPHVEIRDIRRFAYTASNRLDVNLQLIAAKARLLAKDRMAQE